MLIIERIFYKTGKSCFSDSRNLKKGLTFGGNNEKYSSLRALRVGLVCRREAIYQLINQGYKICIQ